MKMKQPSAILERSPLPVTGPWPTVDPFLFCVHHNDQFPAGDGKLGPKHLLPVVTLAQISLIVMAGACTMVILCRGFRVTRIEALRR